MRLWMMSFSIFESRLGIIDLVNKIKINTDLIKLFHFEIYINFFLQKVLSKYELFKYNIWKYHLNKYIYNSSKKK